MSAKTTSPEAAQKKVWKAELRDHQKAASKVKADWRNEQKRLIAACESSRKALDRFMARAEKQMPKQLNAIDRRIQILKGRIGI
jgi:phosphoenolpyruvate-protein kinase (PTS system EI component)